MKSLIHKWVTIPILLKANTMSSLLLNGETRALLSETAVYPVRSAYPQQNPYAQQGTYYTQPLYAAPPHVIHHTTVVQPNGMPATMYPAPIPPPRGNGVTMGMVAGTTMAMSAGTLLTTHSPTPVAPHPVTMPTYRAPGTPTYSYVPPQWFEDGRYAINFRRRTELLFECTMQVKGLDSAIDDKSSLFGIQLKSFLLPPHPLESPSNMYLKKDRKVVRHHGNVTASSEIMQQLTQKTQVK
ncbi:hypothetical protein KIL84_023369 [Mauremys mutica]|uniref:Uncharacterized protein n=1 Tax=Mauremys mutica TaxID=74926 RepID=A0A9D4ARM1_9SAUR|nr:hypothetical protein KIL84_023369 [Mauremys mutica]